MQYFRLQHLRVPDTVKEKERITISINDKKIAIVAKKVKHIVEQLLRTTAVICRNKQGDIKLTLANGLGPAQGIINHAKEITITAGTPNMLLHTAVYALIQLFLQKLPLEESDITYQQEERILMLDMGRKYYSMDTIKKLIDSMCLAQFNYLQLHFSENEGFRIECNTAPEIVSEQYLTKDEVREIVAYARRSCIEIIPDFDSPGHLKQILKHHPKWQLKKQLRNGEFKSDDSALNICNPQAVEFILTIYEEFAELFAESTYFHIGGDEFVNFDEIGLYPELLVAAKEKFGECAEAIDCFVDYVNHVSDKISSWGFIPRVWNDGFFRFNWKEQVVQLSEAVEITYWTKWNKNMAPLTTFVEKGFPVINFNDSYFYYVLGENAGYTYPTYDKIANYWEPSLYAHGQKIPEITPQFPGVALAIWSDVPEAKSQATVWKEVSYLLFAIVQKLTRNVFMKKEDIEQIMNAFFRI